MSVRTRGRAKARRRWLPQGDPRRVERASRTGVRGGALRGRIRASPFPKDSGSNVSIRQRHDRRRLAHVSWDLNRPSSWGLGQRGSRGSSKSTQVALHVPSASYRSAGTEPGGAHVDDVETSEVGIVRERLLQPYGAGGRHLRLAAALHKRASRVAEHVARRARRVLQTQFSRTGSHATEVGTERSSTSGRCIEPRSAEAGASNRAPPLCLPPGANPLGAAEESSTYRRRCLVTYRAPARTDVG